MSRTFRRWCEECCVVLNLYSVVAGLTGCLTNLNVVGSRRRLYQGTDKDRVNNVSSLGHPAKVGPFDWAARSLDCTVAWPRNSDSSLVCFGVVAASSVSCGGVRTFDWAHG
jgi:hypothetical protein